MRMGLMFAFFAVVAAPPSFGGAVYWNSPECQKNQRTMEECAAQNASAADAELNSTYREALKKMSSVAAVKRLRSAQRAWLAYRDSECLVKVGPMESGGSMHSLLWTLCIEDLTNLRIAALREILDCSEEPCPPTE